MNERESSPEQETRTISLSLNPREIMGLKDALLRARQSLEDSKRRLNASNSEVKGDDLIVHNAALDEKLEVLAKLEQSLQ